MAIHVISYDLHKIKNYELLEKYIDGISGDWCRPVDSTWYVKSSYSTKQIRDHLAKAIDQDDVVIVSEITGITAWTPALPTVVSNWLVNAIGTSAFRP